VVGVLAVAGVAVAVVSRGGEESTRFPNKAESALLAQLPRGVAATCIRAETEGAEQAKARVECHAPQAPTVEARYFLFESGDALQAWYDDRVTRSGVRRNSGECKAENFAYEGIYRVGERQPGRIVCSSSPSPRMEWTIVQPLIGAEASDRNGDAGALLRQWSCCLVG
jgi:hypothetical protein